VIVHRANAERRGRQVLKKLREEIDRHLFEVALQAAIGAGWWPARTSRRCART
jgi:GTP-binding protein LepA